jgi:hypothetical protein
VTILVTQRNIWYREVGPIKYLPKNIQGPQTVGLNTNNSIFAPHHILESGHSYGHLKGTLEVPRKVKKGKNSTGSGSVHTQECSVAIACNKKLNKIGFMFAEKKLFADNKVTTQLITVCAELRLIKRIIFK